MESNLETKIEVALDQLKRIREDIKSLDTKITRDYVTKSEVESIDRRLTSVESNITWISRTILGAVVLTILTLAYGLSGKL